MPVKYIPYYPETIDGQAILDNFVRTRRMLRYKDSARVEERLRRGMPLYEVEEIEKVNGGGENLVIRGECVSACAYLKDKGIKVDLVYIDPPFASGADYAKKIYLRKNPIREAEPHSVLGVADGEAKPHRSAIAKKGSPIAERKGSAFPNEDKKNMEALPPKFQGSEIAERKGSAFPTEDKKTNEAVPPNNSGSELEDEELKAFEEKMYGDIWHKEQYLNWMYENLTAIRSIMSETASIYVHLDWHIGHYVKILMDEVFGEENFRNEIVWKRSTAHSDSSGFANLHDCIFYYAMNEDAFFEIQFDAYTDEYIKTYYRHKDKKGVFLDRDLSAKGLKGSGYHYKWKTKDGYWRCPKTTMERYEKEDRLYYTSNQTPRYKQYLEEMEGTPLQDIWTNVYAVNSQAHEKLDYSTQKPEALLERILKSSSKGVGDISFETTVSEPMIVADFFGGSGVTAKVANDLGRRFIHCDVGVNSIQTARDRLAATGAEFTILDIKDGVSLFRNPAQTMDRLKDLIQGLRNEDKLDSFWEGAIEDSKRGLVPVYVPNLLDHSSKVLDIPAMNRIINEAMPDLPDDVAKVIVYYIDIENKADLDRFISDSNETGVEIELRDLKEVLDNVVLGDTVEFSVSSVSSSSVSSVVKSSVPSVVKKKSKTTENTEEDTEHTEKDKENTYDGFTVEIRSFVSDRLIQKIDEFNQKRKLQMQKKRQPLLEIAEIGEVEAEPEGGFKEITISENGLELIELVSLDCTNAEGPWKADSEIKIDKNSFVIRDGKKTKEFWDGTISAKKKPKRIKVRNIAGDESIIEI